MYTVYIQFKRGKQLVQITDPVGSSLDGERKTGHSKTSKDQKHKGQDTENKTKEMTEMKKLRKIFENNENRSGSDEGAAFMALGLIFMMMSVPLGIMFMCIGTGDIVGKMIKKRKKKDDDK